MIIADLFSGCGGAGVGYAQAGWEVVGFDRAPQPEYPLDFRQIDVLDLSWEDLAGFDAIHASPPCFGAGTPVLTTRGTIPIEDVVVGDLVWTHKSRWRAVTDLMNRQAETIRLNVVTTTPEHRFYTARRVQLNWHHAPYWGLSSPEWTPASRSHGQFLASPLHFGEASYPWRCSPWLAGRYVADGWTGRDGIMIAVGANKDVEFNGLNGLVGWRTSKSGPNCNRYTLPSHPIADWLRAEFGHGAERKVVATGVLSAPRSEREEFLAGYLSGDGTVTPNGWVANTVSAMLACSLRLLALSLGYTVTVSEVVTPDSTLIEGRVVNQRNYWSVSIRRNDGRYTRSDDRIHWQKLRKQPVPSGVSTVYDLTVEQDHSFVAWGYIVHNCQAYSRLRNYGYDGHDVHEDYLEYTRDLLKATGLPYVIENVPGAPLHKPMTLCGSSFGLGVRRHRWFEMNWPCPGTRCRHKLQPEHMAVYGHFSGGLEAAREAMGMPWAPRYGITQAIPPAYTRYVGTQLRLFLEHEQDLHGRSL